MTCAHPRMHTQNVSHARSIPARWGDWRARGSILLCVPVSAVDAQAQASVAAVCLLFCVLAESFFCADLLERLCDYKSRRS